MRQFEQDRKAALAGKYNYLNPKKSATVPSEYIKQVLMRGTGFIGGKGRVCKIFETEIRTLRNEKDIQMLWIADEQDAIVMKRFERGAITKEVLREIQNRRLCGCLW